MIAVDHKFECPVCYYHGMLEPPVNEAICFCCGTQFGFDDYEQTHDELRHAWIMRGAPWFAEWDGPPRGWSARTQLKQACITLTREEERAIALQYLSSEAVVTPPGFVIFIELKPEPSALSAMRSSFGAGAILSDRLEIHGSKVGRDAPAFAICRLS
ncbi:hypothetical protein CCAX7_54410 [Capsulimonas corticalis]|uniref:Uncharacterized protein n=1 Tax=Capsulimonas corticalis TaxID=2219043 RepID=A0A9N7LCG6_9BACT|nr:hypothetical protein [Capsulimonas corticalis]BDI33390.1 hypothetical protein CCAX7_54410 [Capsulimonas corticalis]